MTEEEKNRREDAEGRADALLGKDSGRPPASADQDEEEVMSMSDILAKLPSIVFVLPMLYFAAGIEWTTELILMGQLVVVVEALVVYGFTTYFRSCVEDEGERSQMLWFKPQQFSRATEEQKRMPFVAVSSAEYADNEIWETRKSLAISVAVAILVPLLLKIQQPIVMQSFLIPISFIRGKLFRIYVVGTEDPNPWGGVPEWVVKKKLPEAEQERQLKEKRDTILSKMNANEKLEVTYGLSDGTLVIKERCQKTINRILNGGLKTDTLVETINQAVDEFVEGVLVNETTQHTKTTLLMALCRHSFKEIKDPAVKLVKAGAEVRMQDIDGWNALHWCAFHHNHFALKSIKENIPEETFTAIREMKSKDGSTPINIALEENDGTADSKETSILLG